MIGMRETPEEMVALQQLLDRSIGRAGGHLTDIITDQRRLDARQVVAELQGMKVLVVATVTAGGEPRTSCVDGHFLHGTWLFGTDEHAHKARHLKARPALSCTYAEGERVALFTHGQADYITAGHPDFASYDAYFTEQYGSSPTTWTPRVVFIRVRPMWMVGYAADAAAMPREAVS
jgi:hypothetical protein